MHFSNTCPLCTAAAYSNVWLLGIIWQRGVGGTQGITEPRIVRADPPASRALPSVASLAAQAQTLERRSCLCQPGGPDGEGQAEGQARKARRTSVDFL